MNLRLAPRASASFLLLAALVGCAGSDPGPGAEAPPPPPPAAPAAPTIDGHSVDIAAMDRSVKPGADFFMYANGAWYAKAVIPPDRKYTGVDLRVSEEVEARTRKVVEEAVNAPSGPSQKKVGDYYASYVDDAGIEAKGKKPLQGMLEKIAKIKDAKALAGYLGSELRADVDPLNNTNFETDHVFGLWIEQDLNDTSRAAPYLLQGGLGMPDKVYYLEESPRMVVLRGAYQKHIAAVLTLAGVADAEKKAAKILALEKKIAAAHVDRADSEDVTKANNPWPRAEFKTKAPGLDWDAYFVGAGLDKQGSFIVWHPKAITGIAALVKSEPIDVWRDYLTARVVDHVAAFLPKAFADEHFAFYSKELHGVAEQPPRWRRAVDVTTLALGDALGHAYVEKYFPPETKKAANEMVANVVAAFGRRIDALGWMSAQTKAKAKEKLGTLKVGVGYPDSWRDDSGLEVVRGDALGNFLRAELYDYKKNVEKLSKPVDRGEWCMVPHVVNAVNLPVRNALNFPAAILSPPFFDVKNTAAANYGAIGAVIGHEISHSFDDQGAKFDAKGRFVNWWTPEDLAHFEASGAALAAQFSGYKPFPDLAVDGKLTLSENIADLAGLAVAYDAWKTSLGAQPAPIQDGLSGEQQFFLAYAQGWQEKERDEVSREHLKTNGHAPSHYRALTVRNIDAWYAAFDVKPGEPLFLAPNTRVRVW